MTKQPDPNSVPIQLHYPSQVISKSCRRAQTMVVIGLIANFTVIPLNLIFCMFFTALFMRYMGTSLWWGLLLVVDVVALFLVLVVWPVELNICRQCLLKEKIIGAMTGLKMCKRYFVVIALLLVNLINMDYAVIKDQEAIPNTMLICVFSSLLALVILSIIPVAYTRKVMLQTFLELPPEPKTDNPAEYKLQDYAMPKI